MTPSTPSRSIELPDSVAAAAASPFMAYRLALLASALECEAELRSADPEPTPVPTEEAKRELQG